MAQITLRTNTDTATTHDSFPADTYYCKIEKADLVESQFLDKDGNKQYQIAIVWEVSRLTAEQEDAGLEVGKWFRSWFSPYYGPTKNGPSKFQAFIDLLRADGNLVDFDPGNGIDTDDLIGIEARVVVNEKPGKDGKMWNNVTDIQPRKPQRRAPAAAKADAAPRKAERNVPRPAANEPAVTEDGELLF